MEAVLDTRISVLAVAWFKSLVREIFEETVTGLLADPDDGLDLTGEAKNA